MKDYKIIGKESCGWQLVKLYNGFYTYIDSKGRFINQAFYKARPFKEGFALVSLGKSKYAYLTKQGELLPYRFCKGKDFDGEVGKISGNFDDAYILKDGRLAMFNSSIIKLFAKTRLFSKARFKGQKMEKLFDFIAGQDEGMAPIEMRDGSGQTFLDLKNLKILQGRYSDVFPFESGVAMVRTKKNKMIFIDKTGKEMGINEIVNKLENMLDDIEARLGEEGFGEKYDYEEEEYGE